MIDGGEWIGGADGETGIEDIVRRAIGADDFVVLAHVEIDMGVIKRGQGANALEFLGANLDLAEAFSVVEMGRGAVCHERYPKALIWSWPDHSQRDWAREGSVWHDLVVQQAHHEVYLEIGASVDLIPSLSKDEVVA